MKAFTPISELHDALSKNNAAIVVDENDHAVDIITKIDVINYLFEQNR